VSTDSGTFTPESRAYRAALEVIGQVEPGIAAAITAELEDQRASLKLIASENYASPAVLLAMGNWLSDKYAEGTIGRRFYAGCANIDTVETIASEHARSTPTSSRTRASTPTSSPTGPSSPTGSRARRWSRPG
jgi:glycine hydroxymethyltransferase